MSDILKNFFDDKKKLRLRIYRQLTKSIEDYEKWEKSDNPPFEMEIKFMELLFLLECYRDLIGDHIYDEIQNMWIRSIDNHIQTNLSNTDSHPTSATSASSDEKTEESPEKPIPMILRRNDDKLFDHTAVKCNGCNSDASITNKSDEPSIEWHSIKNKPSVFPCDCVNKQRSILKKHLVQLKRYLRLKII